MTAFEYLKKILRFLKDLSAQTGYPLSYLSQRFFRLYMTHKVGIEEFCSLHLYDFTSRKAGEYLLWKESKRISDILNAGATKQELATFEDKHLFNNAMHRLLKREWVYLPDISVEELASFLKENSDFLIKPCIESQGDGIVKCRAEEWTAEELKRKYSGEFIAEALICQHEVLRRLNPSSVNTIRMIAARHDNAVEIIGAGLRVGGEGQFVDNFHHGGVAYPLDLESGIVTGPGIDFSGHPVLCHPSTGQIVPGVRIPFWDQVRSLVKEAAVVIPHVGYVGWDIAVTETGAVLVEGNVNYPGNTIIQIDGPGPLCRLRSFLKNQSMG